MALAEAVEQKRIVQKESLDREITQLEEEIGVENLTAALEKLFYKRIILL